MKSIFIFTILVLSFCVGTFAQTNETSPCPTISVMGPAGIPSSDEAIVFTVSLSKEADKFNPKYNWTISGGEIIEGQGTQVISVSAPKFFTGESLRATVELANLPKECGTVTASETAFMAICYSHRQVDEFSMPASRIDKARLENLVVELENNPSANGYIIEKFAKKTSEKVVREKIQKITEYLVKERQIEKERIVILTAMSNENLTQYFIVPPGASPPEIKEN